MKLGPYELNQIYTGDAKVLSESIPDESIDLIFTDPEYDKIEDYKWLAETAARVLKPDSWLLTYYGIGYLPETSAMLSRWLNYEWHHVCYMPTLNARGAYMTFSNYRGLFRYMKGQAKPYKDARDLLTDGYDSKNNGHAWAKNLDVVMNWIKAYSQHAATVFDPFTGGGTVPAVCKMLNRNYLAFEIDPATAELARQRVAQTQPPLPIIMPEQLALFQGESDD